MFSRSLLLGVLTVSLFSGSPLLSQVLGPCGTSEADKPAQAPVVAASSTVAPLPLPGQKAPNFELDALFLGDVVKKVKLSDFDGKWRLVCFYPADFTFV